MGGMHLRTYQHTIMTPSEQHALQQRNSRAIKTALSLYFALGVILANLPESFVGILPLQSVDEVLHPFLPTIASLSTVTPFPHVLWLYMIAMWTALPVAASRVSKMWTFNPRLLQLRVRDQWFLVGSVWIMTIPLVYFMYAIPHFAPERVSSTGGRGVALALLISQSQVGTALAGTLGFCVLAGLVGVAAKGTAAVWAGSPR
jgi:hypothetical protein